MALPSSGQISILQIANEIGLRPQNISLRNLSTIAGFSTPDKITDFYGYSQTDAERYKNAVNNTGYTLNSTEIYAIDTLFTDINNAGIYSKIYGFYPMLGTQAQALNAKSVSGVRQWAYDLNFSGGWYFDANGATGNGGNTLWYANYSYNSTSLKFSHLGTYLTLLGTNSYGWDIGIFDNSSIYPYAWATMYDGLGYAIYDYDYSDGINYYTPSNYVGNSLLTYDNADSSYMAYQNESLFSDYTSGTEAISGTTLVLGGFDYYYGYYTDNTYGFITFGENLTGTEIVDYQIAINAFQTTLGREVY
jgi:hypothetical protein